MAEAVSRWLYTKKKRVYSQRSSCGSCSA